MKYYGQKAFLYRGLEDFAFSLLLIFLITSGKLSFYPDSKTPLRLCCYIYRDLFYFGMAPYELTYQVLTISFFMSMQNS